MPQLVPDSLDPDTHVKVATSLAHPFQWKACVFPPIQRALQGQDGDPGITISRRDSVFKAVRALARATSGENKFIISQCHEWARIFVESGGIIKHITLMRELVSVTANRDTGAIAA